MPNRLSSVLGQRPLVTAVAYTVIAVLPVYLVGAQVLQLGRDLDFGVGRLGIATGAFFGGAALAANVAGRFMPRLGSVRGLRIGSALTVISCLLAGTAAVWWMVPVALAVGGVANGLIQVAANLAIFDGVAANRQGIAF
ncbi:MAG: MFS transporter, partial [Acidimicrobiia bacterium]|nr:MFS transporter [Acidimicrobiia bacterium]